MFQRNDQGFGAFAGGAAALTLQQALPRTHDLSTLSGRLRHRADALADIDWVPDLGTDIGSRTWWRGLATCLALCGSALALSPGGIRPLQGPITEPLTGDAWEEARAQTISPLAYGSDTGRRMAAGDLVTTLSDTPERPTIDLVATLGQGDGFVRVLERAGVAAGEARRAAQLVADVAPLGGIEPGTRMPITLGPRLSHDQARPLQALEVRARFDLRVQIKRAMDGRMLVTQIPLAIDSSPLRVQGRIGESLYRSARASGAPAKAVEAYIKAIAGKVSLGSLPADAKFDMIVEQQRAETGEVKFGKLLYIGLERGTRGLRMIEWNVGGRSDWYDAAGVGQRRRGFVSPVANARLSSGFGMRFHPILGYSRFHRGVDYAAVYGTPIRAVTDGYVSFAGRSGGHGNHIRLNHAGALSTGYSHLSRFAVSSGQRVAQGQVIGYVGSTGLSTGPHLHFEVYRNGAPINPRGVAFASTSLLSGRELDAFRDRLRALLETPVSGESTSLARGAP